jgi:DNA-binding beta-propeller fold protein YncE
MLLGLLTVIFAFSIVRVAHALGVIGTINVRTNPACLVYDSGKGAIFITNAVSGNVSVISDSGNMVVASVRGNWRARE